MPVIRLHNEGSDRNVYYEFNSDDQPLGEGGMGRVFKGWRIDRRNGMAREVAIKMMFDDLPDHVIERARREASIRILNDNLVEMIDFVEVNKRDAHGNIVATHYHVVSEFLDGVNLDDFLNGKTANHNEQPNLTAQRLYEQYKNERPKFVGFVFRHILSGIIALHYAGYIHRDIDPSNIMITNGGKIKLIDFGIAREVDSMGQQERHLTNTGQFIGKPYYAAPELVLGDLVHQDFRTDIYALGVMLFQLMTGHLPFDGPMNEVMEKQIRNPLPLKEITDLKVRRIIDKATKKKQEKRYQTAAEMLVDIDKWLMGGSFGSSGTQPLKWLALAASIAIIVTAGSVAFNKFGGNTESMKLQPVAVVQQQTPEKVVEVRESEPVKVAKTVEAATRLMMNKKTATEGLEMLDSLIAEGNYEATFLKSRLLFDPLATGRSADKKFYNNHWTTMRLNCGLNPNNEQAHGLLMQAYRINDNDHVLLYQLGCDFKAGVKRGCQRKSEYARWCFDRANQILGVDNSTEAQQYRAEIKEMNKNLSSYKAVKP